jgi:hypothetical protein
MMMETMWTHPVRHPWFDRPSRKRKTSENACSPLKRRRCDSLESGFSQLTLGESDELQSTLGLSPIILPSSVEEPAARDVKMTGSFSYEPEKDREYYLHSFATVIDLSTQESLSPVSTIQIQRVKSL